MARAKLLIILLLLFFSTVARLSTFAERNLPSGHHRGSESSVLATYVGQVSPLSATSPESSARPGSVSMSKLFFAVTDFNLDPQGVVPDLYSGVINDFVSHIMPTPSRPPSV